MSKLRKGWERRVVVIYEGIDGWDRFFWIDGQAYVEVASFVTESFPYDYHGKIIHLWLAGQSFQNRAKPLAEKTIAGRRIGRRQRDAYQRKRKEREQKAEENREAKTKALQAAPWAVETQIEGVFQIVDRDGFWRRWRRGDGKGVKAFDAKRRTKKGRKKPWHRPSSTNGQLRSFMQMTEDEFNAATEAYAERLEQAHESSVVNLR